MKTSIIDDIRESAETLSLMLSRPEAIDAIAAASARAVEALKAGNKIMFAGNGGSAADAQHFAGELVNRFYFNRPPLAAIALSTDTSVLTSIANDSGYEEVFARQVRALGKPGDVLVALSTSGKSPNMIKAIRACREMGIATVGMTGKSGGLMEELCDYCIRAPSESTPRIQEAHSAIGHVMCRIIEETMFGKPA